MTTVRVWNRARAWTLLTFSARAWNTIAIVSAGGFVVSLILSLVALRISSGLLFVAVICVVIFVTAVLVSRMMVFVVGRREFARGYTTMRAYSQRYEYRGKRGNHSFPDPQGVSTNEPSVENRRSADHTSQTNRAADRNGGKDRAAVEPLRRRNPRRALSIVIVIVLILALAAIRLSSVMSLGSRVAWVFIVLALTIVALAVSIPITLEMMRSVVYIKRIRKVDQGVIFFVIPAPNTVARLISDGVTPYVPGTLSLLIDSAGVRLWSVERTPRLLLSVESHELQTFGVREADVGFSSSRLLVCISAESTSKAFLAPLHTVSPMFAVRRSRVPAVFALMQSSLRDKGR
jgi:hypothetical protein